jgi:hypothetical protein
MDRKDKERGQSLIEIAIILPILLLLLLGVAEVGMGLRNYLVVVNANREGARYGAHGRFGDDATMSTLIAAGGYEPYGTRSVDFLRTGLVDNPFGGGPLSVNEMPPNTGIIITHIVFPENYDHSAAHQNAVALSVQREITGVIGVEDGEAVEPQAVFPGSDDIRNLYQDGRDSRVDLFEVIDRHGPTSRDIIQLRIAEGLTGMPNHIIVVETFFMHEPLGKGIVPSPWIMYAQMEVRDASAN